MNLPLAINSCNVCGVKGNRFQCQEIKSSGTVFVLPYEISEIEEGVISSYGMVIRERYCENGMQEVCSSYLTFLIQSNSVQVIVATPEYIKTYFNVDVEEGEIENVFGIKIVSTRKFLSAKVKAEIPK